MKTGTKRDKAADIRAFVEADLRDAIREDGGELEFAGVIGHTVHVRLAAACATCPSRHKTVRHFLTSKIRSRFGMRWNVKAVFVAPYFAG